MDLREYMTMLYEPPSSELIRPVAAAVTDAARAAGLGVSVLTNDMRAFHGRSWEQGIDFLHVVDHIVDCSDTDILKPDPRAFQRAEDIIGVPLEQMLFVDDQPGNVQGAVDAGLQTMWFDIANATEAWHEVARRIGLAGFGA
jgi:putative hydrolase of the HAD superfamily